jgi:acetoin utilization protein AcuB
MTHARWIPIIKYTTSPVRFASSEESVLTAYRRMQLESVRQLPVLTAGKLVGVVFQRDLMLAQYLPEKTADDIPVSRVMSTDFYTVGPDEAVDVVAREMCRHKYGVALVATNGEVTGVFTTTDALRALSDSLTDSLPESVPE